MYMNKNIINLSKFQNNANNIPLIVESLLSKSNEDVLFNAYKVYLRRYPDDSGYNSYLKRLKRGDSIFAIMLEIYHSDECKELRKSFGLKYDELHFLLNSENFHNAVFEMMLERNPTTSDIGSNWNFRNSDTDKINIIRQIFYSQEFQKKYGLKFVKKCMRKYK